MRRWAVVLALLLLALLHGIWPSRLRLDWPMIALIAVAVALMLEPELAAVLPFVKRLKIGEAEIELWKSMDELHKEVEKAETLRLP